MCLVVFSRSSDGAPWDEINLRVSLFVRFLFFRPVWTLRVICPVTSFCLGRNTAKRGAMTPAVEETIPAVQSSVPLLSRRRGSLSNSSSSVKNDASDMELGAVGDGDSALSFRVKTAGDGREYSVSSSLTSTVAQVCCVSILCFELLLVRRLN